MRAYEGREIVGKDRRKKREKESILTRKRIRQNREGGGKGGEGWRGKVREGGREGEREREREREERERRTHSTQLPTLLTTHDPTLPLPKP